MLARLRIAHIAPMILPVPPPAYGGTERVVADLARAQAALGHHPVVFCGSDSTLTGVPTRSATPSLAWFEAHGDAVPPGLVAELDAAQLQAMRGLEAAFDCVHLHGGAHASAVAAMSGLPVFRTIHWRADEADHRLHFETFPHERIIAISAAQARDVPTQSLAGVVHHGIPPDRFRAGPGGGYLAFIGRMTDQKRPDRAIELARRTGRSLRLAGPIDPGNPSYFAQVVEPALSADIRHVGSIGDRDKQAFLGEAAALVFPIDWPEPFGLVLIEALACGTPVIAWRRGSVPELIEDGVDGIVVDSVEEAAARLPEVLRIDRAQLRRRFERRFTAERMAREICALYARGSGRSDNASNPSSPSP